MTDLDKKIDDLFPTWFTKLQLVISGGIPADEREQVLVMPYHTFQAAIKALITQARLKELLNLPFNDGRWSYEEIEKHWAARINKLKAELGGRDE